MVGTIRSGLFNTKNANYIPKPGDIFLWRRHTGVVIEYDEQNDIVTTIEAISSTVNNEKPVMIMEYFESVNLTSIYEES